MKRMKITVKVGNFRIERSLNLEGREEVEGWDEKRLKQLKEEMEKIIAEKTDKVLKNGRYRHFADVLAGVLAHLAVDYIRLNREIGGEI
jgi:hypothetical protein